ncbi:hypothetical protein AB0C38_05030 [Amycolatopsis sp. NPDC048633]|uniref:hypothetical protein n=1 Tax=Amycolatopsis sp. NPDC048633 TaxID=3157095 RepID=UPI0033EC801E
MTEPAPYQPLPASDANAEREVRRGIRTIRAAIAAQAVLYLTLAGFLWYLAAGVDDARDVVLPLLLVSVNVVLLIALVVCSVLLSTRERKVAFAIMLLECAFMAMLLIGLIVSLATSSGSTGSPVGLILWGALMMAVLRPMQKPELRAAFGLPPMQPRQKKK